MKNKIFTLLLSIFLPMLSCSSSFSFPIEFTIINSSDVWGETEPCG